MAKTPQTPVTAEIERARRIIARMRARWAVIGGLAVSARTEPRFTRDVDLALLASDDAAAEELVRGFVAGGYLIEGTIEQKRADRLSTVRLQWHGSGRVFLDVMFASSGIEAEIVDAATITELFPGIRVPVATVGHLIALKLLSRSEERLQDDADLTALAKAATPEDWKQARDAVVLIRKRGFHRGRDLARALRRWQH